MNSNCTAEQGDERAPFQLIELHTLRAKEVRDRIAEWQGQVRGSLRCRISIRSLSAQGSRLLFRPYVSFGQLPTFRPTRLKQKKPLAGLRLLCFRPHEPTTLQALGR